MTGAVSFAITLLAPLALIATALWGLRRLLGQWPGRLQVKGPQPNLRVTATLSLTPQHRLHQVETAAGERLLVVTHPGGATLLAGTPGESPVARHAAGGAL